MKIFLLKKQNGIWIILLLSLIIRIVLFQILNVNNDPDSDYFLHIFSHHSDANGYHKIALNLINTGTFTGNSPTYFIDFLTMDSVRTPGYPVFLAFIYLIFGVSPNFVIILQIALNLVSIYLVYKIATNLFSNKKIALFSAFVFSLDIYTLFFNYEILTETLFVSVILLSTYLFIKSRNKSGFTNLFLSGILLGISALIRPIAILLLIIFVMAIFFHKKYFIGVKFKKTVVFTFAFLFIVSLWFFRNYQEYNRFGFSTISSSNLYMFNALITESNSTEKSTKQIEDKFRDNVINAGVSKQNNPFDNAQVIKTLGKEYVKANKVLFAKQHVQGMVNMYVSLGHRQMLKQLGFVSSEGGKRYAPSSFSRLWNNSTSQEFIIVAWLILFLTFCYVFTFYGIFSMLKAKEYFPLFIIFGLIFYFTLLTGIAGSPRLRIPVVPFYSILTAYGFIKFSKLNFLK